MQQHFHIKLYEKCVHGFHTLNIIEIHKFTEVDAKLLWMNMKFDYCIQIIAPDLLCFDVLCLDMSFVFI